MFIDPQKEHVDRELAMRIMGVSDRTFTDLDLQPVAMQGKAKFFSLDDVLSLRDDRREEKLRKEWARDLPAVDADGELIDFEQERKLKLRAERVNIEIKNAEALGELAPIDLMTSTLRDVLQTTNGWLESVPAIIKRAWPEIPSSVLDTVERECAKVRNGISDARIRYSDERMAEHSRDPEYGDMP